MTKRPTLLAIAPEPLWPVRQGGQVRSAGILGALLDQVDVVVATPGGAESGGPFDVLVLPGRRLGGMENLTAFASLKPRLGNHLINRDGVRAVRSAVDRVKPVAVIFTHSYLAAVSEGLTVKTVVDFANLETERLASFTHRGTLRNRASARYEAIKALRWEPRVARAADLCTATSAQDARQLTRWGANAIEVPNAVSRTGSTTRSPIDGPAVYLASADYAPNLDAGRWLLRAVWPEVRARLPHAQLVIAGRHTLEAFSSDALPEGVSVVGEVPLTTPVLQKAALVVAPVTTGGGRQLKVIEAVGERRTIVATSFSARSVPDSAIALCTVADSATDFASAIVGGLSDPTSRWQREAEAANAICALPSWKESARPLRSWLAQHV